MLPLSIFAIMIAKYLQSYGYGSVKELLYSLSPSLKYNRGAESLGVSTVVAIFADFLGITPALVVAMFVAVVVETITGTRASLKEGKDFESWRFSRCVLKVAIWVALFYMFHAFKQDASMHEGVVWSLAVTVYTVMQVTTMIYFNIEYATSIAENLAILDGKAKDAYVKGLKDMFVNILKSLNKKVDK